MQCRGLCIYYFTRDMRHQQMIAYLQDAGV